MVRVATAVLSRVATSGSIRLFTSRTSPSTSLSTRSSFPNADFTSGALTSAPIDRIVRIVSATRVSIGTFSSVRVSLSTLDGIVGISG